MEQDEDAIVDASPFRWQGPDGRYEVSLRFSWLEGRMECVGVDIASDGSRPITARALHAIPLGKLIEKRRPKPDDVTLTVQPGKIVWEGQDVAISVTRRGGRPPTYGPEHWQRVADVYREAFAGKRLTPTRAVARRFGVTGSAAAKWVAKCRELGLLPKTTRGKARAAVTVPPIRPRVRLRSRVTGRAVATQTAVAQRRRVAASPRPKGGRK